VKNTSAKKTSREEDRAKNVLYIRNGEEQTTGFSSLFTPADSRQLQNGGGSAAVGCIQDGLNRS
jgi:hypothetical protein